MIAICTIAMVSCQQAEPDEKSGTESNSDNPTNQVENDVQPDLFIRLKPLFHTLVGYDETIYDGDDIHRDIAVPADGTSFTFMPTQDFAKHTVVESISYKDPEEKCSYTAFYYLDEEREHGKVYEAGKVLVSNEWCHIAYGDDASIHDLGIEIKPNDTGKKRTLDIVFICDNDYYRTISLHIIQEPLQQ